MYIREPETDATVPDGSPDHVCGMRDAVSVDDGRASLLPGARPAHATALPLVPCRQAPGT